VRATSATAPARFYYNSNRCFLAADRLGKKLIDQTDPLKGSLFAPASASSPVADADQQVTNLMAVLGSPGAPNTNNDATGVAGNNNTAFILPQAARGNFVIMSAGVDGSYFGRKDKGASQGEDAAGNQALFYGLNFKTMNGGQHVDNAGKIQSIDLTSAFDDIVVSGGG
jgi:hypothetical protein